MTPATVAHQLQFQLLLPLRVPCACVFTSGLRRMAGQGDQSHRRHHGARRAARRAAPADARRAGLEPVGEALPGAGARGLDRGEPKRAADARDVASEPVLEMAEGCAGRPVDDGRARNGAAGRCCARRGCGFLRGPHVLVRGALARARGDRVVVGYADAPLAAAQLRKGASCLTQPRCPITSSCRAGNGTPMPRSRNRGRDRSFYSWYDQRVAEGTIKRGQRLARERKTVSRPGRGRRPVRRDERDHRRLLDHRRGQLATSR